MILSKRQKDLIFYVLEGFKKGLIWDNEFNEVNCVELLMQFQIDEMTKNETLEEFEKLIEDTMDLMCK